MTAKNRLKAPVVTDTVYRLHFSDSGAVPVLHYAPEHATTFHPAEYFRCNNRNLDLTCLAPRKIGGALVTVPLRLQMTFSDDFIAAVNAQPLWKITVNDHQAMLEEALLHSPLKQQFALSVVN